MTIFPRVNAAETSESPPRRSGDLHRDPYESLASSSARFAVEGYASWCKEQKEYGIVQEREDFVEHAKRVTRILYTHCDDLISGAVYDVALLHDVVDRIDDGVSEDQKQCAAHAMADYFTDKSHPTEFWSYQSSLMADLPLIENAAEEYRRHLGGLDGVDPRLCEALTKSYQGVIDHDVWAMKEPVIDIENLHMISKQVNIEAFMIKAAEAIDNLMNPSTRPAALLQDCIEAETFHAPMCEVLGLDAMAAKLRSEAAKRRLEGQGRSDLIERAANINQEADYFALPNMFGELFHTDDIELLDSHGRMLFNEESMHFGSGRIGGCLMGSRVTYRIKSIGSIASKLQRDGENELPLDIFGMTVVVEDESRLGDIFAATVRELDARDFVRLETAPSKEEPVYIQGDRAYVERARTPLDAIGITNYQTKVLTDSPGVFRVCKFTAIVTNERGQELPVEIQFLTNNDRKNARLGATAHIVFKQQKMSHHDIDVEKTVQFLEEIYERKHHIDKSTANVNKHSTDRGKVLLERISGML